jgi:hypothetical protein
VTAVALIWSFAILWLNLTVLAYIKIRYPDSAIGKMVAVLV